MAGGGEGKARGRGDPGNEEVLRSMIRLSEEGRHAEMLEPVGRVIDDEPGNSAAHMIQGQALLALGRAEEALASYSRAALLRPDLPQAHEFHAMSLFHLGRFEEALLSLGSLLSLDPAYPRAHYNMAYALARLGRHAEAIAEYDRAAADARKPHAGATTGATHPSAGEIAFGRSVSVTALRRSGARGGSRPARRPPARWSPDGAGP